MVARGVRARRGGSSTGSPSATRAKGRPMPKVADYVLERLTEWGIDRIYGIPGRRDQRLPGRAGPG